jgi:hypothetical protein
MPADAGPVDVIAVALRVAAAIESAGGEYFVGGSLASSLQGEPRATNDIDVVLKLPATRAEKLAALLGQDFDVDVDMLRDALLHRRTCNVFFLPAVMKIDLFALGASEYDEVEFSRRRPVDVRPGGPTLVVKAAEDSVLRKLLWYRDGGQTSERQWRDVVEVLRVSAGALDVTYLDDWAGRLGVADLLLRARQDAGGR